MNLLQQKQENQEFLFNNAEILRFNKLKFQARCPPLRKKNYLKNDGKGNLVIAESGKIMSRHSGQKTEINKNIIILNQGRKQCQSRRKKVMVYYIGIQNCIQLPET